MLWKRVTIVVMFVGLLILPFKLDNGDATSLPKRHFNTTLKEDRQTQADLEKLVDDIVLVKAVQHLNAVLYLQAEAAKQKAAQEEQEREDEYEAPEVPTASGDCYDMAPPGFPSYIIERESRGTTTADNGSHYGCVQLDYSYLTGDYEADWARLWDDGRGACHWNPPNYCS